MTSDLKSIAGVIIVFILFAAMFYIPLPRQFESRGVLIVDEVLLVAASALFYFFIRRSRPVWKYAALLTSLWAFALPLLRLWEKAGSTWNIILGLLPWADAIGYYMDASNLINGELFSAFSGRRPMFASFLAVLLKITDQNLQLVLIVFVALNGLAVFLFALEIQKGFGSIASAAAIYLLHFFYRPYIGTTLTEQLGFPAGLLAFSILVRGIRCTDRLLYFTGLLLLTFSLFVRAGAFFILPALLVFGVLFFAGKGHSITRSAIIALFFVITPVALNILLGRVVASPNTVQFGNFSYTLYGQAVGGKGWVQVMDDYPELNSLQEPELSQKIYRLAFDEIAKNPSGLVKGSIKAWKDFVVPNYGSLFSFLEFGNRQMDLFFQYIVTTLFFIGLWVLWRDRQNPVSGFILVSEMGVFISIPFLPPIDAGIRPYAATIAIIIFPVFAVISTFSKKWNYMTFANDRQTPLLDVGFGAGLILVSVLGGVCLKYISTPVAIQEVSCPPVLGPLTFKVSPGSYLHFVRSDSDDQTYVPIIQLKHVFRSFSKFPYGDFASVMRKMDQPVFFTLTVDLSSGNGVWVVGPPELASQEGRIISACVRSVPDTYPVLRIESYQVP